MTRYAFPLLIITLTVAIVGPAAVDFVADATMSLADATAANIANTK